MVGGVASANGGSLLRRHRAVLDNLSGNVIEELVDIAPALGGGLEEGESVLFRECFTLLSANDSVFQIGFIGN